MLYSSLLRNLRYIGFPSNVLMLDVSLLTVSPLEVNRNLIFFDLNKMAAAGWINCTGQFDILYNEAQNNLGTLTLVYINKIGMTVS